MPAPLTLRATSFATRQDLAAFARFIEDAPADMSVSRARRLAYAVGDNGVGAWGDPTWLDGGMPIVALPPSLARHNRQVLVTLKGSKVSFTAYCRDKAPEGVIDLAPSALRAAGLDPDTSLSTTATVLPLP